MEVLTDRGLQIEHRLSVGHLSEWSLGYVLANLEIGLRNVVINNATALNAEVVL